MTEVSDRPGPGYLQSASGNRPKKLICVKAIPTKIRETNILKPEPECKKYPEKQQPMSPKEEDTGLLFMVPCSVPASLWFPRMVSAKINTSTIPYFIL